MAGTFTNTVVLQGDLARLADTRLAQAIAAAPRIPAQLRRRRLATGTAALCAFGADLDPEFGADSARASSFGRDRTDRSVARVALRRRHSGRSGGGPPTRGRGGDRSRYRTALTANLSEG